MKFIRVYDFPEEYDGIEVLLCKAYHRDNFAFYTGVRADWEPPRGSFTRDSCTILDLTMSEDTATWHVLHSTGSLLIKELKGQRILRRSRLHLLLGNEVRLEFPEGWSIRPA